MQYIVEQIPALAMPDVCTNSPLPGKAFCQDHCKVLEAKTPPIPTDLRGFLQHCRVFRGKSKADFPFTVHCQGIYALTHAYTILISIYSFIHMHEDPTRDTLDEINMEQEQQIEDVLQQTSSNVGQSAATAQGKTITTCECCAIHACLAEWQ